MDVESISNEVTHDNNNVEEVVIDNNENVVESDEEEGEELGGENDVVLQPIRKKAKKSTTVATPSSSSSSTTKPRKSANNLSQAQIAAIERSKKIQKSYMQKTKVSKRMTNGSKTALAEKAQTFFDFDELDCSAMRDDSRQVITKKVSFSSTNGGSSFEG